MHAAGVCNTPLQTWINLAEENTANNLGPSSNPFNPGSFHDLGLSSHPFHPGSNQRASAIRRYQDKFKLPLINLSQLPFAIF